MYDEAVTTLRFPHFFIFQLTLDSTPDNYNHWLMRGFYNIRYRVAADTTRITNINEQLDAVAFDLSDIFNEPIPFMDGWIKLTQSQPTEKIDGVLHAFFSANVRVTKPLPDVPLQESLDLDILSAEG